MKFIVEGANWARDIEVENDFSNKYKDKAFEAMSRAVDKICQDGSDSTDNKEYGFGPVLSAWEKGSEDDLDKRIVTLTEHVLRNCGHHAVAEAFNKKMKIDLKQRIEQMEGYESPSDDEI